MKTQTNFKSNHTIISVWGSINAVCSYHTVVRTHPVLIFCSMKTVDKADNKYTCIADIKLAKLSAL